MDLMERFLEWCKDEIAKQKKQLAALEGGMRIYSQKVGEPQHDMTAESIAHARRVIAELEDILSRQKDHR